MRYGYIFVDSSFAGEALEAASGLGQPEQCIVVYRGARISGLSGEYVDSGSLRLSTELNYKLVIDQRSCLNQTERERQLRDGLRIAMDSCRHTKVTLEAFVLYDSGLESQAMVQGAPRD